MEDEIRFINELRAQYFPFRYKTLDGQLIEGGVQLAVRSWGGFYELVFPKESYDEVLTMLGRLDTMPFMQSALVSILRKALGAKKLKPFTPTRKRPTYRDVAQDIRLYPIGIRDDVFKDGVEQL